MRARDLAGFVGAILMFMIVVELVEPSERFMPRPILVAVTTMLLTLANLGGLLLCLTRWPQSLRGRVVAWVTLTVGLCVQVWGMPSLRSTGAWLIACNVVSCAFGLVARLTATLEQLPTAGARS